MPRRMATTTLEWTWRGEVVRLGAHECGAGPKLLLLPALSSISTRHEMRPLQDRLASRYSTWCVDWPGFGDAARPQVDWTPDAPAAFLSHLLKSVVPHPHAIIAAGHAASYLLAHAPGGASSHAGMVLIAPTWRGPLPTMMGGQRPFFGRLRRLVDRPRIGPLIYRLNVNRLMIRRMAAGHVYSSPTFLDEARLSEKLDVVRAPGARFASARFVTGSLDPLASRDQFLDLGRRAKTHVLLIYGAETPPRSRAEMEAFAALPGIRSVRLPRGKLSIHEEFPDAVSEIIESFLSLNAG
jgi:pimeloyl-ACP methyl ester carboxylesterase